MGKKTKKNTRKILQKDQGSGDTQIKDLLSLKGKLHLEIEIKQFEINTLQTRLGSVNQQLATVINEQPQKKIASQKEIVGDAKNNRKK